MNCAACVSSVCLAHSSQSSKGGSANALDLKCNQLNQWLFSLSDCFQTSYFHIFPEFKQ